MQSNLFISFIAWFLLAIILIWIYTFSIWKTVDKIYSILDENSICENN